MLMKEVEVFVDFQPGSKECLRARCVQFDATGNAIYGEDLLPSRHIATLSSVEDYVAKALNGKTARVVLLVAPALSERIQRFARRIIPTPKSTGNEPLKIPLISNYFQAPLSA